MTHNTLKLKDVKPGDHLIADGGFTCLTCGDVCVVQAATTGLFAGQLFITCAEGQHYLDGQEDASGTLVGFIREDSTRTQRQKVLGL